MPIYWNDQQIFFVIYIDMRKSIFLFLLISKLHLDKMASKSNSAIPGLGWAKVKKPVFQIGPKTLAIPMSLHLAARKKVVGIMASRGVSSGIALFKGGEQQNQYDSDTELVFRQDSWFNYLFGVKV
jgi:hypothetical protein